ncbi:retrovirus-related pol polyprotein from transposon TNT 1-94 [Tanacetum coccineum]
MSYSTTDLMRGYSHGLGRQKGNDINLYLLLLEMSTQMIGERDSDATHNRSTSQNLQELLGRGVAMDSQTGMRCSSINVWTLVTASNLEYGNGRMRIRLTSRCSKEVGAWKVPMSAIIGYGDYKLGDTIISRVYYVEGLKHNLFSVGQFCDGGLEVAFRQHSCHIRNYDMVDLLKGSRTTNLYSISLNDMMSASPVCLLTKASSTKSWLWHRRLNHLNFGTLNELARKNLVRGLPMLKYDKDHLCPSCQLGKSKKASHPLKAENTNTEVLHTLHMDLCGPMRTESINGKKYVLVIVDDYTRFGWVRFLRTKDETPQVIEKFIVKTQRALNATVRFVRTDNGTEFVNKTLDGWFESVGISHETSVPRSPQQNGVVERRNRTLMEAARTMLIFAKAPLFLWAEAVATACYTLNRSLVHTLHGKTYYELLKGKKPNLQYFRVFGSLCYPTNDYDDVGKLKAKADIGIFVGYAPTKKASKGCTVADSIDARLTRPTAYNFKTDCSIIPVWDPTHFDHRSGGDKPYSYPIEYLKLSEENARIGM